MVQLFGRSWTRNELQSYVGNTDQLGGVRLMELADGSARGVRVAQFSTGTGFGFTVHLERGMDIGSARYRGASLTWESSVGPAHPMYFDKEGMGWLRTFPGGLMTGCGTTYAGGPTVDGEEPLGIHGRLSHLPASNIWADGTWRGDTYEMWVLGQMRETAVFAENISLTRRVWTHLGESRLFIRDVVENEGLQTTPHQMLYHCNFGFPLLAEGAELIAPSRQATMLQGGAQADASYLRYGAPSPDYVPRVYYHDMAAGDDGYVTLVLANRGYNEGQGLGVYLRYRQAELNRFTQWCNLVSGTYVSGLEPCNCGVEGRDVDRERGWLQYLQPGEQREYMLEIGVLANNGEIDEMAASIVPSA